MTYFDGTRIQVEGIKPFASYGASKPSVTQQLIDARANGKIGVIKEQTHVAGWFLVEHNDGTKAVYHTSELIAAKSVVTEVHPVAPVGYPEKTEVFHRPFKRG